MSTRLNYIREFSTGVKNVIRYGAYQPRHFIVAREKKVIYLEMPKVANTSIKASIFKYDSKEDVPVIHILASENMICTVGNTEQDYFKFTFVRNPFERLVSCYESKYKSDRKFLGKSKEHLWFDYYLFGYIKEDKGFDTFVRKISIIPDRLKDFHFIPQYNIIYDKKGKCMVDYVGKLENMDRAYQRLKEKYDFGDLPYMNQSGKKAWMDYYSKETAKIVYRMYRKDIEKFGYVEEYRALLRHIKKKAGNAR